MHMQTVNAKYFETKHYIQLIIPHFNYKLNPYNVPLRRESWIALPPHGEFCLVPLLLSSRGVTHSTGIYLAQTARRVVHGKLE
ncbi:Hypothetical predicted protein [Cloeon dipterum]|uniref:Uncharacterized protein n=1 Tax=Cloeon dipterum TaxID=197152 RepID=A0A8S1D1J3_9INSE|nr:Hypothetical predicted protein [Cloeon dipterum]